MESDADPVLDPPHELGIRWSRRRRKVARPGLSVDRQQAAEGKLEPGTVAPGADRVGESDGLRATLEPEASKGVGHEPFS